MCDEDWGDSAWNENSNSNSNYAAPSDSDVGVGRSFGKGRGFTPKFGDQNNDDRRGRGGRGGNRGGRGGGYRNDNSNDGNGGGGNDGWSNNNSGWGNDGSSSGGGWNNDSGDRRGRGGRGGSRGGGRGGSRYGDDDRNGSSNNDWGSSGNSWSNNDNDGGYSGERRSGRGGRGGRGGSRYGDDDRNNGSSNDWSSSGDWGSSGDNFSGGRGGRGGGRGGRGGRGDGGFGNDEGGEEEKARPPVYVPKEISEDDLMADHGVGRGINFDDYDKIKVNVSGDRPPQPIASFKQAKLRDLLYENVMRLQYDKPTPVQKYALPAVLDGRDLMACAQTGSGKTAAFLLPIINYLLEHQNELEGTGETCEPKALILSPTRELTTQIYLEARKFCRGSIIKPAQIYGGAASRYQSEQMSKGCHILVATPGRLSDFLEKRYLTLSCIRFVVLDEADRMLDMGFKDEIMKFINHHTMSPREDRQMLMFSATFSEEVQKIASNHLKDYLFLAVGIVGSACKDVQQVIVEAPQKEKKEKLISLLREQDDLRGTLVFVGTKRTADFLASCLSDKDFPTTSIHGDRFQHQREEALRDFRYGSKAILVATSVAARGLDIKGVKHVINYDLPDNIDEYVHRIGRTGRLGNRGKATTFYDASVNSGLANTLVKILQQAGQEVPPFLAGDAGAGDGYYEEEEYGGRDYREGAFRSGERNVPQPIASEECWD